MASLADLPLLAGFFSYSREDDEGSGGKLSKLRERVQEELRGQLGRTKANFKLWQDKIAIAHGELWEETIKKGISESVFFVPIITPTAVRSPYCKIEFDAFLARERELDRNNLIFPILYIRVSELTDNRWRQDPLLTIIGSRQYEDWLDFRHVDPSSTEFARRIEKFCENICRAMQQSWVSPQERQEAEARQREEEERRQQERFQQAESRRREQEQRKVEEERKREAKEEERRKRSVQQPQHLLGGGAPRRGRWSAIAAVALLLLVAVTGLVALLAYNDQARVAEKAAQEQIAEEQRQQAAAAKAEAERQAAAKAEEERKAKEAEQQRLAAAKVEEERKAKAQPTAPTITPAPTRSVKRVALVIGNSSYKHAPSLITPRSDAAGIAVALKMLGFQVIESSDVGKDALDSTIRDFGAALRGADVGVFFYAGHGMQVSGQNYLVPVDAQLNTASALDFEMVRLDLVQRTMERETPTNILFLDACRDNPLASNLARAMGSRSTDIGRGLAAAESGINTLISFSTQPGNIALDGAGRNSPYTGALLKQLTSSSDDLSAMLIAVRNDVMRETQRRQVPWEHSALTGRFYFKVAATR
jgi:Caspase domain/TIR domain